MSELSKQEFLQKLSRLLKTLDSDRTKMAGWFPQLDLNTTSSVELDVDPFLDFFHEAKERQERFSQEVFTLKKFAKEQQWWDQTIAKQLVELEEIVQANIAHILKLKRKLEKITSSTVLLEVVVPRNTKWEPRRVTHFTEMLYAATKGTVFALQILLTSQRIVWQIWIQRECKGVVKNAILLVYPEAQIIPEPSNIRSSDYWDDQEIFSAFKGLPVPFPYAKAFITPSVLVSLVETLSQLPPNGEILYRLIIDKDEDHQWNAERNVTRQFFERVPAYRQTNAALAEIEKIFSTGKCAKNLRMVVLTFAFKGVPLPQREQMISGINRSIDRLEAGSSNRLIRLTEDAAKDCYNLILSPDELAVLWHLPTEHFTMPQIDRPTKLSPEIFEVPKMDYIELGTAEYQGQTKQVYLPYADRVTHANIVGRTRVGKSTFMHNLVHQDIANGKTVAVIDPHGDLVKDILATSIPPEREPDVILFDVADDDYPVGLNLLTVPKGVAPEIVATQTLEVIRKLFADQWSATRMEDALYAAIRSLVGYSGATIRDIPRLFSNQNFRAQVLNYVTDPEALDFWHDEFNQMSPGKQREVARPINTRVRKFFRDTTIRRLICQRRSLSFRRVLDTNKIFLASLGGIGEIEAQTLGALLISKIQMAAMSRVKVSKVERQLVYLYIDEVQNFATTSLPVMFSEAGKYGLSLVTANQFLRQLTGPTLDAIMGNVGTSIIFATGVQDAKTLGSFVQPFSGQDLRDLDRFTTVVKMQVSGQTQPAFSMMTPPPIETPKDVNERINRIRQYSRDTYGRPAAEIDKELAQRYRPAIDVSEPTEPEPAEIQSPEPSHLQPGEVDLDDFWE